MTPKYCEQCGRDVTQCGVDLTDTPYRDQWRIMVTAQKREFCREGATLTGSPELDRELYFCDMECLGNWAVSEAGMWPDSRPYFEGD